MARRLEPRQRREQLLDTGAAMFAERPYEDVSMEDIAVRAGVSRGTLYHYFPSKRDLYVGILKRASNRFLARMSPDPELPLAQQLATGLEAHIQSLVDHPFEAVAINRGALSYDPAIQAIISEELNVVGQHLINQLVAEGYLRDPTEIAVEGWLAFVRAASVKWIQSQNISRVELTKLCVAAFDCALGCANTAPARPKAATTGWLRGRGFTGFAGPHTTITIGAEQRNRNTRPLVWKRTADDITANVQRARDALRQIKMQTDH
jgi:AcrR family transcriptional regulator